MTDAAPQQPIATLHRRYRFSASHRLHRPELDAARNRELFGKCNNPFGHGHNYTLQVSFQGPVAPDTGMVVNLAELDPFVHEAVLAPFDCANLNEMAAFAHSVPSTEYLCLELWQRLEPFIRDRSPLRLQRVRLEETSNNAFDYFGGEGSRATAASFDATRPHPSPNS